MIKHFWLITGVAFAFLPTQRADAGIIIDLTDDGTGGVVASIFGTGTFLGDGPNLSLELTNLGDFLAFSSATSEIRADQFSGTFTVDSVAVSIDHVFVDADSTAIGDDFGIDYGSRIDTSPPGGQYAIDLTATWSRSTLAFSDLNLGVYGPGTGTDTAEFDSVSFTVSNSTVPEPQTAFAFACLAIAGAIGRFRGSNRSD